MRRALRIVFWTYLVLLHGFGAYVGYKLYGEWKHKQAFTTRVERVRFGPGIHAMLGANGEKSTAVTRVYTPETKAVAWIEEEAGEVMSIQVQPPGHRFQWHFSRETAQGPWKLYVTEHTDPATVWKSIGSAMIFDDNADGVPEKRVDWTTKPRTHYKAVEQMWVVEEATP
jgi:hypothetical protein